MKTLNQLYGKILKQYGEQPALVMAGETLTYGELYRAANRVANALARRGMGPNSRVALLMSNCLAYSMCDMGIVQAGATKIPLNDMLGEKEIAYILEDSGAEVVFAGTEFFEVLKKQLGRLPSLTTVVGLAPSADCPGGFVSWDDFQAGEPESPPAVAVGPDDGAVILYTGGTTGRPKGVFHSQKNILINTYSHVIELELQGDERILLTSPLPHSAGFVLNAGLVKGATHYIEKKFDPAIIQQRVEEDRITFTFMVPTMIYRVMDYLQRQPGKADFSSLRTLLYGASPITSERLKQGLELFGPVFMQLYGQSEAPNFITRLRKSDHYLGNEQILRSCGQPVAMAHVKVVDEQGRELPPGTPGEIAALTPYNMVGYLDQPDTTAETVKDGWVLTGDLGMMDADGYVYLLDRKKDMIITGGLNVYTTEVEDVIQKHPGVSQVAVIGVPHPDWGEAIMAVVVPQHAMVTAEEILAWSKQELSGYKAPKEIVFTEALPVTPYGKVDKKRLRSPYWESASRNIN